jgi:hypothetical protein
MCAAEARNAVAVEMDESSALWGVRVLLAAAVARGLRAGMDEEAIHRAFEVLVRAETGEEGDADA